MIVEGTTITTVETDTDITVQEVVFTADGRIQLPTGGDIVDIEGNSVLGTKGAVVERTIVFPEGSSGDTRGTVALTPAGETYICVADYQAPEDSVFTVVHTSGLGDVNDNTLVVDLRDYPELLAFVLANEGLVGDTQVSSDGGVNWIEVNSYYGLTWYNDPPWLGLTFVGAIPTNGQEFLIKWPAVIPAIWNRIVDLTANSNEGGYGFNLTAPGDLTLETTRPDGYEEDCDLNLYAADDIFIEAYGDDVVITAANQVRIQSNNADYQYQWTFDEDGDLTLAEGGDIYAQPGSNVSLISDEGSEVQYVDPDILAGNDFIPGPEKVGFAGVGADQQGVYMYAATNDQVSLWKIDGTGNLISDRFNEDSLPPGDITDIEGNSLIRTAVSTTAPGEWAKEGHLWYNTEEGRTYLKYNNTWVDASPPVVAPTSTYLSGLTIENQTISSVDYVNPDVKIGGNLVPDLDLTYDLGSPTNQWNSLHISASTIYMGGRAVSLTDEGLKVDGGAAITVLDGGKADTWLLPV